MLYIVDKNYFIKTLKLVLTYRVQNAIVMS
nr:MAG TPA: hypothetical protein [Caudoviricetes sp.]